MVLNVPIAASKLELLASKSNRVFFRDTLYILSSAKKSSCPLLSIINSKGWMFPELIFSRKPSNIWISLFKFQQMPAFWSLLVRQIFKFPGS